jgi:hypothetical protein
MLYFHDFISFIPINYGYDRQTDWVVEDASKFVVKVFETIAMSCAARRWYREAGERLARVTREPAESELVEDIVNQNHLVV